MPTPDMEISQQLRLFLALAIAAALLVIVAAALFVTDAALSVWERLKTLPDWVIYGYIVALLVVAAAAGWVIWRLLWPKRAAPPRSVEAPPTEDAINARLAAAVESGVDTQEARRELEQLRARREAGQIYVAVFGDISTGKSSLIRALVPGAELDVSARGGTTRSVNHYVWRSAAGDCLVLADVPGSNEAEGNLGTLARDEALRSHIVIYVCDGDLTRTQFQALQELLALRKPTIVALNKTDRYTVADLEQIRGRLAQRLAEWPQIEVVAITAGGTHTVVRIMEDGREQTSERPIPTQIVPLQLALQHCIDRDSQALDALRDSAVFVLAEQKLDKSEAAHRAQQAAEIVSNYTRKAVVGALASVSPGTDIVVQGYLGTNMVKELCGLYQTPARDLDVDQFLKLAQGQLGKTLPFLLALAGNTLKAFPGMGTVAGGIAHAIAYGLIFDALGRSVSRTLANRGELRAAPAVTLFKESLSEDLEGRARRLVELALAAKKNQAGRV